MMGTKGFPLSEEHKKKISLARKGQLHSEETKQRMSLTRKGKPKSNEWQKSKSMSDLMKGHNHYRSKPANIYCYGTNELIAENVVIREWCKQNSYNQSAVYRTARGERKHYKRIYATYI